MNSTRRQILQALGVTIASSPLIPLGPGQRTADAGQATCTETASEVVGPYPNHTAFYRQDIREGRSGLPLQLALTIVNTQTGCSPIADASVEIWQCDATGYYSEYAQPGYDGTGQTFLRGLQVTDASGQVTFTTVYPAAVRTCLYVGSKFESGRPMRKCRQPRLQQAEPAWIETTGG